MSLSVVVASQSAFAQVRRCLDALEAQRRDGIGQIILITTATDDFVDEVRQRFPQVEVARLHHNALVPELWGKGVLRSREPS